MPSQPEAEITFACLQFQPCVGAPDRNRETGLAMAEQAAAGGADLTVLPKLADYGSVFECRAEAFAMSGTPEDCATIRAWVDVATARGVHLVGGFCKRGAGCLCNSAAVIGPEGLIGVYRKSHLWDAENLFFEPGDRGFPVFATPLGRIDALVCYDGWFPEAWRLLVMQGADIVCVPTNWVQFAASPMTGMVDFGVMEYSAYRLALTLIAVAIGGR